MSRIPLPRCPSCGGRLTVVSEGQRPKRLGAVVVFDHVPFLSCNACELICDSTNIYGAGVPLREAVRLKPLEAQAS